MTPTKRFVPVLLFIAGLVLIGFLIMQPLTILHFRDNIAVLFPKGRIAVEERDLLLIIQVIMLLVIVPVYVLTFIFSWRYRAGHPTSTYDPDLIDNHLAEYIWWLLPLVLTIIVGVITWVKTEELDPFKPLVSDKKAITIQAVALQWKWLFIYPEEQVAVVNFLQIPTGTPIHFEITADAPMNSFWIPALGGQIYAMPKMKTELNLIADEPGDFRGSSANFSGDGFAGMHFITRASSDEEYQQWLASAKESPASLNDEEYAKLAEPSKDNPVALYQLGSDNLFHQILMKYMHPQER